MNIQKVECPRCKKTTTETEYDLMNKRHIVLSCASCGFDSTVGARIGDEKSDGQLYMGMIEDVCQEVMSNKDTTTRAKTAALDLQLAAMNMSVVILRGEFWKEEKK